LLQSDLHAILSTRHHSERDSMNKLKILLLIGLGAAVAACSSQATPSPTVTKASATATPSLAAAPTFSPATLDPATMCKATSLPKPVPGLPPIGPNDWVKGAASASVVLLEYGDYQ